MRSRRLYVVRVCSLATPRGIWWLRRSWGDLAPTKSPQDRPRHQSPPNPPQRDSQGSWDSEPAKKPPRDPDKLLAGRGGPNPSPTLRPNLPQRDPEHVPNTPKSRIPNPQIPPNPSTPQPPIPKSPPNPPQSPKSHKYHPNLLMHAVTISIVCRRAWLPTPYTV